jgi:hypothetical protein
MTANKGQMTANEGQMTGNDGKFMAFIARWLPIKANDTNCQ